jgi:hypothetical protein
MIAPVEEVVTGITLNFCLLKYCSCNENGTIRGGGGGMDNIVKAVGCRPWLWVVLLQVSWTWNTSNITSKNALI